MPDASANGTRIHYRFEGPESGPTIMLANSIADDLAAFDLQVPILTKAGFRVLRYDSRGQGKSAVPPPPYTMETLADDAVALMDVLKLELVHFFGFSMGGMVAQNIATRHGQLLRSLILANTAPYLGPKARWDDRIETLRTRGVSVVVDDIINARFTKSSQARLRDEVAKDRARILATPVEGFCGCCAAIRDMDQREDIRQIRVPTLILAAERDMGTTVDTARLMQERIANSKLVVIPDAAHFSNIEQPALFNAALVNFLESSR